MKYIYTLFIIMLIISCKQRNTSASIVTIKKDNKYQKTLLKYKYFDKDSILVQSPINITESDFIGIELDSSDAILFPKEIANRHFNDPPGLFAILKFQIDKNTIGLLTRTPAEYYPSSIKLFYYNITLDSITNYIQLADNWGDAGDYEYIESKLFFSKNNKLYALQKILIGHDNSVDDQNDTTIQEWTYYNLYNIASGILDTIDTDQVKLEKCFNN